MALCCEKSFLFQEVVLHLFTTTVDDSQGLLTEDDQQLTTEQDDDLMTE